MLSDIQKHFEAYAAKTNNQLGKYTIPREYVVPNSEIKIDGQGTLQRLLEAYQETRRRID